MPITAYTHNNAPIGTDWVTVHIPLADVMRDDNASSTVGVGVGVGQWEGWDVNALSFGNVSKSCGGWFNAIAADNRSACAAVWIDSIIAYRDEQLVQQSPANVMCATAESVYSNAGSAVTTPTVAPLSGATAPLNVTLRGITRTVRPCTCVRPMIRMVCVDDAQPWAVGDSKFCDIRMID